MSDLLEELKIDEAIRGWIGDSGERFATYRRQSASMHAFIQGAYAAEIQSAKAFKSNPYECGSHWRWEWSRGFDIGRRLDRLVRQLKAVVAIIDAVDKYIPPNAMVPMDAIFELVTTKEELKKENAA
jgi:hypothetical protein